MELATIVGSLVVGVVVLTAIVGVLIDKSAAAEKDLSVEEPEARTAAESDYKVTKR